METLYTLQQVMASWNVTDEKVMSLVKKGEIEGIKLGRNWRFKKDSLDAYIEKRTVSYKKKKSLTLK